MGTLELGECSFCKKITTVNRKYYYYEYIKCDCCSGDYHFEIIWYCNDCTPQPSKVLTIKLKGLNPTKER